MNEIKENVINNYKGKNITAFDILNSSSTIEIFSYKRVFDVLLYLYNNKCRFTDIAYNIKISSYQLTLAIKLLKSFDLIDKNDENIYFCTEKGKIVLYHLNAIKEVLNDNN